MAGQQAETALHQQNNGIYANSVRVYLHLADATALAVLAQLGTPLALALGTPEVGKGPLGVQQQKLGPCHFSAVFEANLARTKCKPNGQCQVTANAPIVRYIPWLFPLTFGPIRVGICAQLRNAVAPWPDRRGASEAHP